MSRTQNPRGRSGGEARQARERKKAVALVLLLVVGFAVWGRTLISSAPRPASAQFAPAAVPQPGTEEGAAGSIERPVVRVALQPRVERDLFALDRAAYRRAATEPEREIEPPEAKSEPDPSDELERTRRAVYAEARALSLQGTLEGAEPRAVINGQFLLPGESVRGFELIEIGSRRVTLVKQGVRVVLEM